MSQAKKIQGEFILKREPDQNQENKKIFEGDIFPVNEKKLSENQNSTENKPGDQSNLESKNDFQKSSHSHQHTNNKYNFLSSLVLNPEKIRFSTQEEDEKIIMLVREHFITNIPWIVFSLILSIVPFIMLPIVNSLLPFLDISNQTKAIIVLFYYLILFGYLLANFMIWYFQIALVTNKRIVDVDVPGILYRNVSETKLDLIQDVSYTQIGAIRSFFNYGDVMVQTAGELPNFEFYKAPEPDKIIHIISDLIGKK